MPKTALIINPYIHDFKLYDEWMHPIGLYLLKALLQESGYETLFFNCLERDSKKTGKYNTAKFRFKEIKKPTLYKNINRKFKRYGVSGSSFFYFLSQQNEPDLIFIGSMMTYWLSGVSETIQIVRKVFPHSKIIVGGIGARLFSSHLELKHPDCMILKDIGELYSSIHLKKGIEINKLSLISGFSCLKNAFHAPILTTLGCPFSCSYCASSLLQPNFWKRSSNLVIHEIDFMSKQFGVVDFAFFDDALLVKGSDTLCAINRYCKTISSQFRFHTPNGLHIKYIDQEKSDLMFSMGFKTIRLGYETGSTKYRNHTDSKASKQSITDRITVLKSSGFRKQNIGVYIMGGLEGQNAEELISELNFVASLGVKVKPVFLSPVPGTRIFEHYAKSFPQIRINPLWHNDTFFITQLPGWSNDIIDNIKKTANKLNQS
ncbi:B12-binding domain-containing radical SAM protein [Chitinispirillales bacterium ANBcel5]|uniref:B12-binding domain-containing radical SAM protein n=1 Tax=Cellulosispirillum alkaliphilum TaxID=3039283 RepID=UPI002A4E7C4D|nr:B12-binding domain-containing radical SAM protein [Chitinispirillales bacterium ANBcel5]